MANFVSPIQIQIQIGLVLLVRPDTCEDTSQPWGYVIPLDFALNENRYSYRFKRGEEETAATRRVFRSPSDGCYPFGQCGGERGRTVDAVGPARDVPQLQGAGAIISNCDLDVQTIILTCRLIWPMVINHIALMEWWKIKSRLKLKIFYSLQLHE